MVATCEHQEGKEAATQVVMPISKGSKWNRKDANLREQTVKQKKCLELHVANWAYDAFSEVYEFCKNLKFLGLILMEIKK